MNNKSKLRPSIYFTNIPVGLKLLVMNQKTFLSSPQHERISLMTNKVQVFAEHD